MDWTLASQINYTEHSNEVPFATQFRLSQFPTDDFLNPGVGLAATNSHRLYVPVNGPTTHFDQKKVIPKEGVSEIKTDQTGFGSEEAIAKKNEISAEQDLKRKLLGEPVFNLMSSPKIKTAKLNLLPKEETKKLKKVQKGEGSSKVHIFKK